MPRTVTAKAINKPLSGEAALVPTRERILAAAEGLFASHGFDSVTMPAIAEASGITAGAIYKHFASKAALFFEVVRRAVESAPASSDDESLPSSVADFTTPRMMRVRQMAVEVHYAAARSPDVRLLLRGALDRQIGEIEDVIRATRPASAAVSDTDPKLAATAVLVFIMGLTHLETLAPELIGDHRWWDFVKDRTEALLRPG